MSRKYLTPEAVISILQARDLSEWCKVTMFHINNLKFNFMTSKVMEFDRYLRSIVIDKENEYIIFESAFGETPREKEEVYKQVIPLNGIYHIFWIEYINRKEG